MGKRRRAINVKLSDEEFDQFEKIYGMAFCDLTQTSFARDIILGKIQHPYFEDPKLLSRFRFGEVSDSGPVTGSYEAVVHFRAIIYAAQFMMIQSNPDFKKVIKSDPDLFNTLVAQMRGYNFNDKEQIKTPLPENLEDE